MILEEAILLVAIMLLASVIVAGAIGIIWARRKQPFSAIEDLENRVQSYLESSELDHLEFSDYLERKIRDMETAADLRRNPPKIVIADVGTKLNFRMETTDVSTQSDMNVSHKSPQIILVKPLSDVVIELED